MSAIKLNLICFHFNTKDTKFSVEFFPIKTEKGTVYRVMIQSILGWHEPAEPVERATCSIAHKQLRKYLHQKNLL